MSVWDNKPVAIKLRVLRHKTKQKDESREKAEPQMQQARLRYLGHSKMASSACKSETGKGGFSWKTLILQGLRDQKSGKISKNYELKGSVG